MKFLCDHMLGTLAKWLRILGFDTRYANLNATDDHLLQLAQQEHRTLITKDKELLIRAKRHLIPTIPISSIDLDEQLTEILSHTPTDPEKFLTRCTVCNHLLERIDKKNVHNKVPPHVYQHHEHFWICPQCTKIYWKGTHYQDMHQKITELTNT